MENSENMQNSQQETAEEIKKRQEEWRIAQNKKREQEEKLSEARAWIRTLLFVSSFVCGIIAYIFLVGDISAFTSLGTLQGWKGLLYFDIQYTPLGNYIIASLFILLGDYLFLSMFYLGYGREKKLRRRLKASQIILYITLMGLRFLALVINALELAGEDDDASGFTLLILIVIWLIAIGLSAFNKIQVNVHNQE